MELPNGVWLLWYAAYNVAFIVYLPTSYPPRKYTKNLSLRVPYWKYKTEGEPSKHFA